MFIKLCLVILCAINLHNTAESKITVREKAIKNRHLIENG